MAVDIGIDLGTASVLVYVKGKGVVLKEPSVVAFDRDTNKIKAIGEEARLMLGRTPGNIVAYRTLGKNRKYEDYDLFMRLCADGFKSANLPEKLYRFHYDKSTRRVSFSMRCDEFKVRTEGFKRLGLMPIGFFYALKPILLGFIPRKAMIRLKEKTTGV